MPMPSLSIKNELLAKVDEDRHNTPRSEWFRGAARTQLLVNSIEDNNADLPDDWVEQALYSYIESEQRRKIEV